jgi:hypothetical protein
VIIDDAKNSLASLRTEISEEARVKSKDDLHVGDILSLEMDEKDGLKLRGGYKTRDKFVVVIGINSKGDAIGALLINSEIDYTKDTPELKPFQYPMKQARYPEILDYDSWLDCTDLFLLKSRKIVAKKAEFKCRVQDDDFLNVLGLVRDYEGIARHIKVKYGIIPKEER